MAVALGEIMRHPANRARLARAAAERIKLLEGRRAAEEAEREARTKAGEDTVLAAWREAEKAKCAADPEYFFDTYLYTFNPKLAGKRDPQTGEKLDGYVRFRLWPKQREWVKWAVNLWDAGEEGLTEKSRDVGATYLCAGLGVHHWLFVAGFKLSFGSQDVDSVDVIDNPDSIFEKVRIILRRLPEWMMPAGFNWRAHNALRKLINPENGASIIGDVGKRMGRSGRSTVFVWDETAFTDNADKIETAISANTECLMMISTANGMGNLFFRKRMSLPPEKVFRIHYTDDPRKTPEWARAKRASLSHLPTAFASEYDIDYAASLEGVCIPAAWVRSSQELAKRVRPTPRTGGSKAGLDVGAGKALSVFISRNGPRVRVPIARGDPDTVGTANWALELAVLHGCDQLNYDAPGVGVGVTSALKYSETKPDGLAVRPINTGVPAPKNRKWPDKRTSFQTFANLKAELWWLIRTRAQRSHELLQWLNGETDEETGERLGVAHEVEDCLLLPSGDPASDKLGIELSVVKAEPNLTGKMAIESKKSLAKRGIPSPDYADALVLTEAPAGPLYDAGLLAA